MGKYYAVKKGRTTGIYETWAECQEQVNGFSGAAYKSFLSLKEAEDYMGVSQGTVGKELVNYDNLPYAFVDGSYNPDTKVYGFGGFLCIDGKEIPIMGSGQDEELVSMRNVAGEILGAQEAINVAFDNGVAELVIYYDYEGIEKWANGDWKANKKGTIDYRKFIEVMRGLMKIHFVKVKAHTNIEGNERADQMAKEAVGITTTSNIASQKTKYDILKQENETIYLYNGPRLPDNCGISTALQLFNDSQSIDKNYLLPIGSDVIDSKGKCTRTSLVPNDIGFDETFYLDEIINAGCAVTKHFQGENKMKFYYLEYIVL